MSLHRRLLLTTVSLVLVALVIADVFGYLLLRSVLLTRAGADLAAASSVASKVFKTDITATPSTTLTLAKARAVDAWYAVYNASGQQIQEYPASTLKQDPLPGPELPPIDHLPSNRVASDLVAPHATVVRSVGGSFEYAVAAFRGSDGSSMVVGVPLVEMDSTLELLAQIELGVTAAVVIAVAVASAWLVRLGLRPLGRIEATASAIAEGDLARRVSDANERTEVGRLGRSLNRMLEHIEAAFTARRSSEDRLRQLVADAAHELRTPLTSIRGYAELFRRGANERPDDLARAMAGIESESARMGQLLDDLLLLARLDADQPLDRETVDVAAIAEAAVDAARAVDADRPIELDASPAWVEADASRLRQIVDNLLANARVHTPPGTRVRVSVRTLDATVELSVADNGPGVPAGARTRLFERFYRSEASRSRLAGGAGLGLAIVAAVASAHGGSVVFAPVEPSGSTFTVRLPAVRRPTSAVAPGTSRSTSSAPAST